MENGDGKVQELERAIMETKMANGRLMEENESFQLMLSEKTLSGEFSHGSFLRPSSSSGAPTVTERVQGSSLADELDDAADADTESQKKFQHEIATLKDQNKALTLYINNIISRLLQHSEFEAILDKNPNLMNGDEATTKESRPASEGGDGVAPMSFLERTKSIMGSGVRRSRPTSTIAAKSEPNTGSIAAASNPSANENPDTAPRVPFSRNTQRSLSGGHRRSNSDWAPAQVVNNMYRGGPPAAAGQLSPGLSPQPQFFTPSPSIRPVGSSRMTSGQSIPTISESEKSVHKPNRDSKISSGRNSVASDRESNPSSPPRSTTSSGEKTSGAIMMGSKPRPLRLVQEAEQDDAAKKAANRQSWLGWFNKGPAEKAPTS